MERTGWRSLVGAALGCAALLLAGPGWGAVGGGATGTAVDRTPTTAAGLRDPLPPHFLQMQFSLLPGGACVNGVCGRLGLARGEFFDDRAVVDFNYWWSTLAPTARPVLLLLDSRGGSVQAAIHLARRIRTVGLATGVARNDVCLSACVYVLMGGRVRHVDEGAVLGVHAATQSLHDVDFDYRDGERVTAALLNHFADMGISAILLDSVFGSVSPTQLVRLSDACITASRLDNTRPAPAAALPCGRPGLHFGYTTWLMPSADLRSMIQAADRAADAGPAKVPTPGERK